MDPAVSMAQERKLLHNLRLLTKKVMPDGLDSAEQRDWATRFIITAVKDKVAQMSQQPSKEPPKPFIDGNTDMSPMYPGYKSK